MLELEPPDEPCAGAAGLGAAVPESGEATPPSPARRWL